MPITVTDANIAIERLPRPKTKTYTEIVEARRAQIPKQQLELWDQIWNNYYDSLNLTEFHLAGQHDQSSHGNWAEETAPEPEPATSRYGTDPAKIRRWAIREGKDVGARGRLPKEIVDEYDNTFGPENRPEPAKPKPTKTMDKIHTLAEEHNELAGGSGPAYERNLDREAARRTLAVRAVPELARYGDALILRDMSWDPASTQIATPVAQHLADLAQIPDHLVKGFIDAGGKVIVGDGPITRIGGEDLRRLSGVQPRGWPAGTSYDDVAGVFNPQTGEVILGNIRGGRNTPVSNFSFHEFGHGVDSLTKKISLVSQEDSFTDLHSEFKRVAKASGYLNNYYVQATNPGAGASEFFADGFRAWSKAQVRAKTAPEERNAVVRNSFAEAGTYVPLEVADKILDYYDRKYGQTFGKADEPKPTRTRKSTGKKTSVRQVSFQEEARAKSLQRQGKTYAEISDILNISTGTLSRLLGKEAA